MVNKLNCEKLGHFTNYAIIVNNRIVGGARTKKQAMHFLKTASRFRDYTPEKNMIQIHRYVCSIIPKRR